MRTTILETGGHSGACGLFSRSLLLPGAQVYGGHAGTTHVDSRDQEAGHETCNASAVMAWLMTFQIVKQCRVARIIRMDGPTAWATLAPIMSNGATVMLTAIKAVGGHHTGAASMTMLLEAIMLAQPVVDVEVGSRFNSQSPRSNAATRWVLTATVMARMIVVLMLAPTIR